MVNTEKLVRHLERSVYAAELGISKLPVPIYYIDGMSSPKGRRLLNNLCEMEGTRYLEIGCWKGSTLISAISNNYETIEQAVAIDNYSEFQLPLFTNSINFDGSPLKDETVELSMDSVKEQFRKNIERYIHDSRFWPFDLPSINDKLQFFDGDCFNPEVIWKAKYYAPFNIYFFDGEHTEEAQANAFLKYNDLLADQFICVVDDWCDGNAEKGTRRAFEELGYNIVVECICPARYNGDVFQWWNGLGVFVISKS